MKWLKILLSLPKSIYFNFCYLPMSQAYKLPIWISYNTKFSIHGKLKFDTHEKIKIAMVRIGFHKVPICNPKEPTILSMEKDSSLIFKGTAHIGCGTKIYISNNAQLILGDNFAVSASSQINCYKRIIFGRDIQFSWDCLTMDADTHNIYDESGNIINESREIIFGNKIWIGCRATILKGSVIPDNCVIGSCSLVSGKNFIRNSIIVGNPAKSIKTICKWEL